MHPHVRAEIPSLGSTAWVHVNPIDGYQCSNELRAQLNLTNDHKRKKYHTCKACPVAWSWKKVKPGTAAGCSTQRRRQVKPGKKADSFTLLRRITNSKVSIQTKEKVKPGTAANCSTHTPRPTCETRKMASCSLYLNELLIQKCKFRHRFTVNFLPRKAFPEGLIPPCRTTVWVTHLLRNILSNYWCGMHRTCKNTSVKPDRHCENGSILWRDWKNHQNDVTTCFATASRCVTTVPFSWRDGQNHQMMWPPAMQQHPGASIRFLVLGETDRITKWCDHQLCNSIQVHHYGSISWRDGQNHQMMWPPAMQQHPGASIRFLVLGETDRITKWCDHQLCNSIQVHHYGSISWRDGQNHQMMWPPAMQQHPGASLRFHFVARRVESPRAGTRYCVQYLIHQLSTASLARLGQMAPCPLL